MSKTAACAVGTDTIKDAYRCEITESLTIIESGVCIRLYGLNLYNVCPYRAAVPGESCRIDGITPDYDALLQLKTLIEELDVYPIHLREIVEDFLS